MKFLKRLVYMPLCMITASLLYAKEPGLEQTLANAATTLSNAIDGKVHTVAVLDIRSDHWALSDYIVDELNHELTNKLSETNVAERDEYSLSLIQQESDYQLSGAVSDETIQEIGAALGADCIVLGDMETVSGGWQLILRASTVKSKKVLASWRGKVSNKEKEVRFQVDKSKNPRPVQVPRKTAAKSNTQTDSLVAMMIDKNGQSVSVLHPGDTIRFKVTLDRSAYLAILCIDAHGDEEWLPLENNYIRAGESRIFPDIPGAVLRVDEGTYGNEQVIVYAASTERELPNQKQVMAVKQGERGFSLMSGTGAEALKTTISYKVER